MKNDDLKEMLAGLGLVVLLLALLNPFEFYMPSKTAMTLLAGVAILALLFASFVWKETADDERESFHRLLASRTAFLAGAAILLLGIVIQTFAHNLDPWLVLALGAAVIAKLTARAYSRTKL